ncbi:hypothetical protein CEXT_49821 [Caerostris extrusa]|uniref:Uncharacterized protein n=1 Tax=Caerostris extrusa TaxID=172846 RepID=A0AAV4UKS4_CAEEX|nr:hypothetical protein CEXT_49821 [Caerostris extrusa]
MNDDDYDYDDEAGSSADMPPPAITLFGVCRLSGRKKGEEVFFSFGESWSFRYEMRLIKICVGAAVGFVNRLLTSILEQQRVFLLKEKKKTVAVLFLTSVSKEAELKSFLSRTSRERKERRYSSRLGESWSFRYEMRLIKICVGAAVGFVNRLLTSILEQQRVFLLIGKKTIAV